MKNYSNWSKGGKWLFGLLTGGIGNILLKTIDNVGNAISEMKVENAKEQEDMIKNIVGNEDVLDDMSNVYNDSSTNSFNSYRNRPDMPDFSTNTDNPWQSWLNSKTGAGLTNNEAIKMAYQTWERLDAQSYNHNEAVDARMWEQYVANNKYQWETQSMQEAGVNPAMVYGQGSLVPTHATGVSGTSSGQSAPSAPSTGSLEGLFSIMTTLMRLPSELKSINADIARSKADAIKSEKEGNAALMNAETNRINAGTGQGELKVHERQAAVAEAQVEIQKLLADSNIHVNDETAKKIAEETLYVADQRAQLPKLLEVSQKNADAAQKQAIAAMRNADAAVQNAATNDYMSNYQSDYLYVQRLGQEIINGQNEEILKALPEKLQAEIKEMQERGYYFNEQGQLAHKNQALVTAQTVRQYELMVTDVANCAVNVAGSIMTGGLSGAMKGSTSVTYDPAPANGTYGTYGDLGTTYWYNP